MTEQLTKAPDKEPRPADGQPIDLPEAVAAWRIDVHRCEPGLLTVRLVQTHPGKKPWLLGHVTVPATATPESLLGEANYLLRLHSAAA